MIRVEQFGEAFSAFDGLVDDESGDVLSPEAVGDSFGGDAFVEEGEEAEVAGDRAVEGSADVPIAHLRQLCFSIR